MNYGRLCGINGFDHTTVNWGLYLDQGPYPTKQGQARGYGRITQFCPFPIWGHYFHAVTVANSMDRISCTRYQMKDMNMIFPQIPQNLILVEWFINSGWSKLGGFLHFSENGHLHSVVKIVLLITFFQNALIYRWVDLESWNQLRMVTNISSFHVQKKSFKNFQPFFCIQGLKCWPQKGSWNTKFCRVIRPYPLARPWPTTWEKAQNFNYRPVLYCRPNGERFWGFW